MAEQEDTWSFDPWETSTGLPDKITVRIDNPHFGYNVESNQPTRCLFIMEGTVIGGSEDGSAGEFNQWFSVGDGWEPAGKGGARLVREDGRQKQINNNSNYGRVFTSLKKCAEEQGLMNQLRKRGTPFDAATWLGLELYFERETYTYQDRDTKETKEGSRLNVARIEKMGDVKVSGAAKGETVQESATVGSGAEASASSNGAGELDPKTKAKLKAAARNVRENGGEHKAFVEAAFEVDGVLDNPVAEEAIMDQGADSIWESVAS